MGKRAKELKVINRERKASKYSYELRGKATRAELALLEAIHEAGWRYVFQSSQFAHGRYARLYIADFRLWLKSGRPLLIEIDGSVHRGREAQDAARTEWLAKAKRAIVIRFTNEQVLDHSDSVLAAISEYQPLADPLRAIEVTPTLRRAMVTA